MRVYNTTIISLATMFGIINILLSLLGQKNLEVYFIAIGVTYIIVTLFNTNMNPVSRVAMNGISTAIFIVFMVIISFKIIEILQ